VRRHRPAIVLTQPRPEGRDQALGRGVRIHRACVDRLHRLVDAVAQIVHGRVDERLAQRLANLLAHAELAPRATRRRPLDPRPVAVEGGHELAHPLPPRRHALHDGRRPALAVRAALPGLHVAIGGGVRRVAATLREGAHRLVAQRDHQLEIPHRRVGPVAVGLVHGEDVGALEDARLDGLHLVAHARGHHHERRVGRPRDLQLVLPDAHRLDQDHAVARRVEDAHHVPRAARQAAHVTARRHGPDEHAVVGRVPRHADAVAEDGAAGVRARRIHGDHADTLARARGRPR
jgi:hypothetical protein